MKHIGDICKINGAEIEPVWCITGGSPCQDLSVAGKRAGLAGERSGLFMEQVRIVKEMREHDKSNGRTGDMVRPRFLVWENVPGAFSSNGGEDFRAVLEEIVRIAEPTFSVPRLEGKWTKAGAIDGDGWSIAWRTHDAQYWGVPQRRRRISLVADFGGSSAGGILFERKSLSGDSQQSQPQRKETSRDSANGVGVNDRVPYTLKIRGGVDKDANGKATGKGALIQTDLSATLGVTQDQTPFQPVPMTMQAIGEYKNCDVASSCKMRDYKDATDLICEPVNYSEKRFFDWEEDDKSVTLRNKGGSYGNGSEVLRCEPTLYDMTHANDVIRDCGGTYPTLQNRMGTGGNQVPVTVQRIIRWIVRRLTPLECERLQGYPDGWTDIGEWVDSKGKKHKEDDSPRYKALGNSIALPFWYWMFCNMAKQLPEDATLGSLFDGIGGFPLCWENIHGKGTARWASEIEEYPIAVTKIRFGGD